MISIFRLCFRSVDFSHYIFWEWYFIDNIRNWEVWGCTRIFKWVLKRQPVIVLWRYSQENCLFFYYFTRTYLKYRILYSAFWKAPGHECIFSKYSGNLNISEIFWACYTRNSFPIIFPKNFTLWRQSKFKISRFKSNQFAFVFKNKHT